MPADSLKKVFKKNAYSHVYNTGVEGRNIFENGEDYDVFTSYLSEYLSAPQDPENTKKSFTVKGRVYRGSPHQPKNYLGKVELIAYSLKPNHFHLVMREKEKGFQSRFLRSLSTRYSMYFNKKYNRRGSLFEGPYKSAKIGNLSVLAALTVFIHTHLQNDKDFKNGHSSYNEYIGERNTPWLKPEVILKRIKDYKDFAEKMSLSDSGNNLPRHLLLEPMSSPEKSVMLPDLERSQNKIKSEDSFQAVPSTHEIAPQQRIPEFIATSTIVFLLLFGLGLRNVTMSASASTSAVATLPSTSPSPTSSPVPEVAGETDYKEVEQIEEIIVPTEIEQKNTLVVKTEDGSLVNLRLKPDLNSEIVGKAKNGDRFEFMWGESGWYMVRLSDGAAYISADFIEVESEAGN